MPNSQVSINKMKTKRLNDKQRRLAEENHNLIYSFAKKLQLDLDEYYGVLATGLCKAALSYVDGEFQFSTLAYACMLNAVKSYRRDRYTQRRILNEMDILSLDEPILNNGDDQETTVGEIISDKSVDVQNDCEANGLQQAFSDYLNGKEREILKYLLQGLIYKEIAEIMGGSKQNVGQYVQRIRRKWIEFNETHEEKQKNQKENKKYK